MLERVDLPETAKAEEAQQKAQQKADEARQKSSKG